MDEKRRYFLSSLESVRFEPVRECEIVNYLTFDTGKIAAVAAIYPGVIGQEFGISDDIDRVILATRFEGSSIDNIVTFPCFVFIAISAVEGALSSPIRKDDLQIIAWGELYRTFDDAERHVLTDFRSSCLADMAAPLRGLSLFFLGRDCLGEVGRRQTVSYVWWTTIRRGK